ncbi:MAG: hypothetical protein EU541_00550 [Promethearchaeota archaeon]|nr:MAG: hypothetical protein EU541_00550 [Candidatus Lokiarchaeota archaeon]
MFIQDFNFFNFWDSLELGLYMVVVGYYFLIFAYFLIMRFRLSKKSYWFFFSMLFIALSLSRVFFIIYYFYAPETLNFGLTMISYRLAVFFTWIGISCLMGMLGILLFPPDVKEGGKFNIEFNLQFVFRVILIISPIIVGILALVFPDALLVDITYLNEFGIDSPVYPMVVFNYPVGRLIVNFIFQPLFNILVPIMFFYLAKKTFGVIRKSYALNGIGFLIYYFGRILYSLLKVADAPHTQAILPPLVILLSLLIIVIANSFEALK